MTRTPPKKASELRDRRTDAVDNPRMAPRRRAVLFAYYYPPLGGAGSLRAASFVRHLSAFGWDVTVVTPRNGVYGRDPSLDDGSASGTTVIRTGTWEPSVLLRRLRRSGDEGVSSQAGPWVDDARVGAIGDTVRRIARRMLYFPDSSRGWIGPAWRAARKAHRAAPFDLVLSSSPPVSAHVAALRFRRSEGIPWVADWRDAWMDRLEADSPLRTRGLALERELILGADGIVAASDGLLELLRRKAPTSVPGGTVRNGWEAAAEGAPPIAPAESAADAPTVLHAGTVYGRSQDLAPFLRALTRVRETSGARAPRLLLAGKVDPYTRGMVESGAAAEGATVLGFRGHAEVVALQRAATGLLLLGWQGEGEVASTIVPAKTYEYLAAGRPVLALGPLDAEPARLLRGRKGVTLATFGDEETIARWLHALGSTAGLPSTDPVEASPFTRREQARRLAAVMDEVSDRTSL
jgi:glycosyltransferase involved in cell wall biosynthesis